MPQNPLFNGNDHGPSLPPETPNNSGHTHTYELTFLELCEKNTQALSQITKETQERLTTTTTKIRYLLAKNSSTMADFSPPPSPNTSNNICSNLIRAETSILPVGTSPPIFLDSSCLLVRTYCTYRFYLQLSPTRRYVIPFEESEFPLGE